MKASRAMVVACLWACTAQAEETPDYQKNTLTGDWGGTRTSWAEKGVAFEMNYRADLIGNVSGGIKEGARGLDNLDVIVNFDGEKLLGSKGTSAQLHILNNNGGHPDRDLVGSAQGIDNIEVPEATAKIFQAWVQQNFLDDKLSILVGLYALDSEFYINDAAGLFLHSSLGMGTDFAQSGINGPSSFPFTSLGARVKIQPAEDFYVMGAVLDGIPGDPNDPEGTHIRLGSGDGALIVAEAGWTPGGEATHNKLALGGWRYTEDFPDNLDVDAFGNPVRSHSQGMYVLGEYGIYKEKDAAKGLSIFGRFGVADGDVNQFNYAWSTGLVYTGLIPGRDEGKLGFAIAGAHNSGKFKDASAAAGAPVDSAETVLELTYGDNITPWLSVQPDIQYIIDPGANPALDNALVLGARIGVTF